MVFHWNLSDSNSAQVSRMFANSVVDWIVFTRPFLSESSSPFIHPLVTVPKAPIIIGINVTFMFLILIIIIVVSLF